MELKRLRIRVHPLFLAVGVLSALTGGLLVFLAAVLAALEHECAHAYVARRYGYSLSEVVLMPYGAVIKGDLSGMGRREYFHVLAAGPCMNAATGIAFVALWWLFPETYPYTELAAAVSFSLFFVNLLPAYPLDGGRMLRILLEPFGKRRARIAVGVCGGLVSAGILGYFVWSCFSRPAFSALLFAVLLLFGTFGGGSYARIDFSRRDFSRGVEERRIAVDAACTVGDAVRFLREDRYLTLLLFEGGEFVGELGEEEYLAALNTGEYGRRLGSFLPVL